ncbi:MAG: hypothetical protein EOQ28_13355 [Mesorhizobium sp.]|uniref:hypothetical protein n=1 Tax=Mesorhizobium sp. TaxID=1871066 RepID=UPI000FE2E9EB|nr:hypothetical protein [Mesorhizobium sp.]RWA73990.1 MAG: hypothetical protein EOQ28_13355 [Mesorhizobium sp.]RWC05207.1 MAG: hypothetical protein EOQ57_02225 [Mesorhizobium sp.]RWK09625.1 MAG: hypothetical protein EOR42_02670 [Mesorhizobium sp.]RWK13219.1 MAG: hypothetical protein EOR39_01230 [Mesorhizobium sp.]TIQ51274.1 MAG: hypothetical protein E5X47_06160 [Mesorhizobium sp.]
MIDAEIERLVEKGIPVHELLKLLVDARLDAYEGKSAVSIDLLTLTNKFRRAAQKASGDSAATQAAEDIGFSIEKQELDRAKMEAEVEAELDAEGIPRA